MYTTNQQKIQTQKTYDITLYARKGLNSSFIKTQFRFHYNWSILHKALIQEKRNNWLTKSMASPLRAGVVIVCMNFLNPLNQTLFISEPWAINNVRGCCRISRKWSIWVRSLPTTTGWNKNVFTVCHNKQSQNDESKTLRHF